MRSEAIAEILSAIGLDSSFNTGFREYLNSLSTAELTSTLNGARQTLNLAKRHTVANLAVVDEPTSFQGDVISSDHSYADLLRLKESAGLYRAHAYGATAGYVDSVVAAFAEMQNGGSVDALLACHRNYVGLYHWVSELSIEEGRDARETYWHLLAATQPDIENRYKVDRELLWRRILLHAGAEFPHRYVRIGLLGLCRSDRGRTIDGLVSIASTFLEWALRRRPSEDDFTKLCHDFLTYMTWPLVSGHRDETLDHLATEILHQRGRGFYEAQFVKIVAPSVEVDRIAGGRSSLRGVPTQLQLKQLIAELGTLPADEGLSRCRDYYERYAEHTRQTGNIILLGQVLTRLSTALGHRPAYAADPRTVALWKEMGVELIRWQPNHSSGWRIWTTALKQNNGYPGLGIVLWESHRRFPDVPNFVLNLADHLTGEARLLEAEHFLRTAIEKGTRDAGAYFRLARLIASQAERIDEAIAIGHQGARILGFRPRGITRQLREVAAGSERGPRPVMAHDIVQMPASALVLDHAVKWVELNGRAVLSDFRLTCPGLNMEDSATAELKTLVEREELALAEFFLVRALPEYRPRKWISGENFSIAFTRAIKRFGAVDWDGIENRSRTHQERWLLTVARLVREKGPEYQNPVGAWLKGETKVQGRAVEVLRGRINNVIDTSVEQDGLVERFEAKEEILIRLLTDTIGMMFDEDIAA